MEPKSFFTTPDGDWFQPTPYARGPWDPHACHAGPPTGLLARASELAVPNQDLVRLTVDLVRPIPFTGFRIATEVTRSGRTVSTTRMRLLDGDDNEVITAAGMHLQAAPVPMNLPTTPYAQPDLGESVIGPFPIGRAAHDETLFTDAVEVRYPPNEPTGVGPKRMWMRTVPLLDDEEPSPFQRICPLSDCGNAVSRNANPDEGYRFMNTDLTIMLHRKPVGDWLGMDSVSRWEPTGHGISDSLLFDQHGAVGRALQTLIIHAAVD